MNNTLYYGDNLEVLRRHVANNSIDLIYLDPPFNSDQNYNVLFAEQDGGRSAAQIEAFEDTWRWDQASAAAFQEVVEAGGRVSLAMRAFRQALGDNDLLAYLSMMAPRLLELNRALNPTGSIYLHCDPTASHYLKMLMDAIFGPDQFRNEIVWRRTGAHNKARRFGPIHDTILLYSKTNNYKWKYPKRPYMKGHVEEYFVRDEKGYRTNYYGNVLTGSGRRGGESGQPWKGIDPTSKNRHWAIPGALRTDLEEAGYDFTGLTQHQILDRMFDLGYIKLIEGQEWPIYERCLKDDDGQYIQDIWAFQPYTEGTVFNSEEGIDADVRWLSTRDQERLGYPTQKPEGMLERIIRASSDDGDVVLDPFCGCGTAIAVAQRLHRRWIGIDITYLAVALIKCRLRDAFGEQIKETYKVIGEPKDIQGARALAAEDRYQFQCWALDLVGARQTEPKKGADRGIDGCILFHDDIESQETKQIVLSVKSGGVQVAHMRDLRGVMEREHAAIGVLITLEEPTRNMKAEASGAGFYESPWGTKHPRLQILTINELFSGTKIDFPPWRDLRTFKKAPKAKKTPKGGGGTLLLF